jgi:hypothetical protein
VTFVLALDPDFPDAVALFDMAWYDLTAGIKGLLNIRTWKSGESNG